MQDEIPPLVKMYRERTKNPGTLKIFKDIREVFVGVTKAAIQDIINRDHEQKQFVSKFDNKARLRPVVADRPMERVQADLRLI